MQCLDKHEGHITQYHIKYENFFSRQKNPKELSQPPPKKPKLPLIPIFTSMKFCSHCFKYWAI